MNYFSPLTPPVYSSKEGRESPKILLKYRVENDFHYGLGYYMDGAFIVTANKHLSMRRLHAWTYLETEDFQKHLKSGQEIKEV